VKKLAIFVEGQTEQIFVKKLLEEIAGQKNIRINVRAKDPKQMGRITSINMTDVANQSIQYYVLIYNCCNDDALVSEMSDQYSSLINDGYNKIIGLRDVYPKFTLSEIDKLERGLKFSLRGKNFVKVLLAVMEIEAWFLSEWKHFEKISPILTPKTIYEKLGFNPQTNDMEERPHPAEDLNQVYQLVGRSYQKRRKQTETIVSSLDYDFLYLELVEKVHRLGEFVSHINTFIDS
jgi:hypothetical protein